MNLFKQKPLVIDFFTTVLVMPELTAPDYASKFLPTWWTDIPKAEHNKKFVQPLPTMKRCSGFIDYFSNSVMLPMWADFVVEVGAEGTTTHRFNYADNRSSASVHAPSQRGAHLPDTQYQHLKLGNPWRARTTEEMNWVFSQPTWCFEAPETLIVPPGMLEFKHQHSLHVNLFVPRAKQEPRTVSIAAGQPLAALTPMTSRDVVIKRHLVSEKELAEMGKKQIFFLGDYITQRAAARRNKDKDL